MHGYSPSRTRPLPLPYPQLPSPPLLLQVEQVLSLASDLGLSCVQAFAADSTQLFQRLSGADSTSSSGGSSSSGSEQGRAAAGDERSEDSECSTSGSNSEEGSSRRRQQLQLLLQPESFDYVMLDAPCSALGLRPRLQLEWTLPQLKKLAAYQRAFLHTAVHMLKPGGTLVYCTCTINPGSGAGGGPHQGMFVAVMCCRTLRPAPTKPPGQ